MATNQFSSFDHLAIDRAEIPQRFLDLDERVRTNLFPWRGQFSPGLIDILLSTYASSGTVILDPFSGVGTTLMEAARKQFSCFGTEVNPAAVAMAETVNFIGLNMEQRRALIEGARAHVLRALPTSIGPLFDEGQRYVDVIERIAELARHSTHDDAERNIFTNVLIRVCELENATSDDVHRAFVQHSGIIESLPFSLAKYAVMNSDARTLPLEDGSVDFVLTSPPYINVFNYHQNNRRAMELLGWDLLHVARSEFGSNRKHRGNRFLTVIQYCLDMEAMFRELRRVMKPNGRAIFVVGRESNVLGVAFHNGSLVGALAEQSGFVVSLRQERKFKNRFGALIYEDLIHLSPVIEQSNEHNSSARQLAVNALSSHLSSNLKPEVIEGLRAAIEQALSVRQSPNYIHKHSPSVACH